MRLVAIAAMLLIPGLTIWNLMAESVAPDTTLNLGPRLKGVTAAPEPVPWSLKSLIDGSLQTAVAERVTEALPTRPVLVRLSNSVRKRLFGLYGAPGVIAGEDGELIEEAYLREYCSRDLTVLREHAEDWIPMMQQVQQRYLGAGKQFLYLRTPSKMAYMPEKFLAYYDCRSRPHDRQNYLPVYSEMLSEADIRYVDAATLTHNLRGRFDVELFPQGGVHWNQLAVAHAADAILERLNRHAGTTIAPRLRWTYTVSDRPTGTDTDLIDVVNVLFGRPRYPVPVLTFADEKPCSEWPAATMRIAMVGGSFVHDLARVLIRHGCLRELKTYSYLVSTVRGGNDYRTQRDSSNPEELRLLREADVLILEENEGDLPGMLHSRRLTGIILDD